MLRPHSEVTKGLVHFSPGGLYPVAKVCKQCVFWLQIQGRNIWEQWGLPSNSSRRQALWGGIKQVGLLPMQQWKLGSRVASSLQRAANRCCNKYTMESKISNSQWPNYDSSMMLGCYVVFSQVSTITVELCRQPMCGRISNTRPTGEISEAN